MHRITILLADDHTVVRQGLRMLIEADGDIQTIGEAKTGREAVQLTLKLRPEIVLMDIGMPLLNGIEATRQIIKYSPVTKILILSAHNDPVYAKRVPLSGAMGYLIKGVSGEVLTRAIRDVHKREPCLESTITGQLSGFKRSRIKTWKSEIRLTSRETELLQLISESYLNKQIAYELGISIKTVEKHRQHLMQKLNIHDIAGLTRFAIAHGFVEPGIKVTSAHG